MQFGETSEEQILATDLQKTKIALEVFEIEEPVLLKGGDVNDPVEGQPCDS
jgi:hypothetical protein